MIFLVYCIASLFYYVLVLSPALRDIFSYFYGAILPVCAESAVKPQTSKQKNERDVYVYVCPSQSLC